MQEWLGINFKSMARYKLTIEELCNLRSRSNLIVVNKITNATFSAKLYQGKLGPFIQSKKISFTLDNNDIYNIYSFYQKRRIVKVKDEDKIYLKLSDFLK